MAIKTFTVSETLTASDTNTYLANSGLVYVTKASIPTSPSVTAVTVSNCFSSTYDAYQIIVTGGAMSAGEYGFNMQLGSTTSGYYNAGYYLTYANGNPFNITVQNGNKWEAVGIATPNGLFANIHLNAPYLASNTFMTSTYVYNNHAGGQAANAGYLANSTQYTGFTLFVGGGSLSSGTVTVYGVRKG